MKEELLVAGRINSIDYRSNIITFYELTGKGILKIWTPDYLLEKLKKEWYEDRYIYIINIIPYALGTYELTKYAKVKENEVHN